ncbi:hypothetical protein LVY75_34545 (plasmid) [Sinorhizobium sp. B11]
MIEFKQVNGSDERLTEIAKQLKTLDAQMASPNIKETKHAELNALHRKLSAERETLAPR